MLAVLLISQLPILSAVGDPAFIIEKSVSLELSLVSSILHTEMIDSEDYTESEPTVLFYFGDNGLRHPSIKSMNMEDIRVLNDGESGRVAVAFVQKISWSAAQSIGTNEMIIRVDREAASSTRLAVRNVARTRSDVKAPSSYQDCESAKILGAGNHKTINYAVTSDSENNIQTVFIAGCFIMDRTESGIQGLTQKVTFRPNVMMSASKNVIPSAKREETRGEAL